MSIVVVATLTPKPDAVDAVREALLAAIPKVHEEPGCELYSLHEADGAFVMVEKWADADAMKAHGKAEPLATLGAALAGKMAAAPDVRRLTPVPAGDAGKGAV
ncbi:antibiotic biosynthesis monooxygenase [Blastococcus sp. TML/M2B]|uniref:putative quinol monooxygenase n=1 Tax=unclassified Blastococcus TaxID=2619396 RepID=UPI001909561B|nr:MULTISPECIES: putative quinol monooxygenase [unclassified Blastococcus]MBN1091508.1 antibiotic biosynthesis monooxygenase [Blastococcus sp. TML/M2B]MBN1094942.1 antibiotic biosynthesis monooxygenase [Blastococcus sp. TML/C7B]